METRFAIIENGKVVNVAIATVSFAAAQGWVACADDVAAGWSWNGFTFVPPLADGPPQTDKTTAELLDRLAVISAESMVIQAALQQSLGN